METSLIVKLQVSMCYEHTHFSIKDSLALLWQSGDKLTWAFGEIDEELFRDACDQFDIQQILPLASPVPRTVNTAYHILRGVTRRLSTGTLESQLMDRLHSYEGQGCLQLAMQLWSDTPQAEGVVDAMIIRSEEILGAWAFITEKRAMAIKGFQMFQSLTHRIHYSEKLRKQVSRPLQ